MAENIIAHSFLFSGLEGETLRAALAFFSAARKTHPKGDLIHRLHQPLPRFGLVLSGCVQVGTADLDGNPLIFAHVEAGGVFGESLCFLQKESPVEIRALTRCEILWLSADQIRGKNQKTDLERELTNRFIALLARRALSMNDRVQVLSRSPLRDRILVFLSQYARQYGPEFAIPYSREDLAVYLGVNRSALSRALSALQKEGLITYRKNRFALHSKMDF